MKCFDLNNSEWLKLLAIADSSYYPLFSLKVFTRLYYDKYNRFPRLDEIPGMDSTLYINDTFKIKDNKIQKDVLFKETGTDSVKAAQKELNNRFPDRQIYLKELEDSVIIEISERPRAFNKMHILDRATLGQRASQLDSVGILNNIISRLANIYGILVKSVTTLELHKAGLPSKLLTASAFIYNGNIFINTDHSSVDAPLHEFMHLIMGSLKISDLKLFNTLISLAELIPISMEMLQIMEGRSHNDAYEELLVTEWSKYVSDPFYVGPLKEFIENNPLFKHDLNYNISRALDSIIMGDSSVRNIGDDMWAGSLYSLMLKLGSRALQTKTYGSLSKTGTMQHRKVNNLKAMLLSGNMEETLELNCNG